MRIAGTLKEKSQVNQQPSLSVGEEGSETIEKLLYYAELSRVHLNVEAQGNCLLFICYNNYIAYICSMKANKEHKFSGIYCIRNTVNGKVYIGKSHNIYLRIINHCNRLKVKDKKHENSYLINSWHKYGRLSFEYFVLEKCDEEKVVAERELFWMKQFKSLDRNYGYNLRSDSDSVMIVHAGTRKKISERLQKEWDSGIRKNHGLKLSKNWKTTPERNAKQSEVMTKALTKYIYIVDGTPVLFKELKSLGLANVIATFHTQKTNIKRFKGKLIERVKN